jgi:IPT/TIG domain
MIDGTACAVSSSTGTTIVCITGAKTGNATSSLVVSVNGAVAINNGTIFYYGYLWSKSTTWGNYFAPIDGDLVYVTAGRSLIVDVPYVGVLNTVIVE